MTPNDFPILKSKMVMVDLETLSRRSDAAIVSIGAVKFTFDKGIESSFKVNITPESSVAIGLSIEDETVAWWKSQSKEAIQSWCKNPVDVSTAIDNFVEWWGPEKNLVFCCNGMSFDCPILTNTFIALGRREDRPWKYHNEFDLRTIYRLFGVTTDSMKTDKTIVYHDALEDAKFQTQNLLKLFEYEPF